MKARAVTIIELLVVIAIITILAAIILTATQGARAAGRESACLSNLKQVHVAWTLYREQNNDEWAPTVSSFGEIGKSSEVFRCPDDRFGGVNRSQTSAAGYPISYDYVLPLKEFREALIAKDDNPGIVVCALHGNGKVGDEVDPFTLYQGKVLRLRADGSVKAVDIPRYCTPPSPNGQLTGRPQWMLLTDVRPGPPQYVRGMTEPCR